MKKIFVPHPNKRELITIFVLVLEIIIFSIFAENFLSPRNFTTIIQNSAEIGIVSIGMSIVIILGGIDLSVGPSLGVSSIVAGTMLLNGANPVLALFSAMAISSIIGVVNGLVITTFKIPDIIATLATMNILRAVIFALLGGKWLTGIPVVFSGITTAKVFGIPVLFFVILGLYCLFYYLMTYTKFGRHIYAIGSNPSAANLVGISINKVKLVSYAVLGLVVGFCSILYISRMGSVDMNVGSTLAIQCIAAVFLGGTSVSSMGGKGTLVGTLAGVFFIAIMKNGIVLLGIPSLLENAIIGSLILISVLFDYVINNPALKERLFRRALKREVRYED